jgi:hypothetical protein
MRQQNQLPKVADGLAHPDISSPSHPKQSRQQSVLSRRRGHGLVELTKFQKVSGHGIHQTHTKFIQILRMVLLVP